MTMKRKTRAKILRVIIILTLTSHKMSRLACSPVLPNSIGTNMMTMVTTKKTRAKTDLFTLSKNNDNNDDNVTIKTMLTCSPVPKGIQLWSLPPMMERPRGPPDLKM